MSAVEELRAAATLLREAAAKATPGPWTVRPGNDVSANVARNDDLIIDGGGYTSDGKVTVYGAALNTDAAWIALASPLLSEPLAAWLESCAKHASKVSDPRNQEIIADSHALAVARVINRTAR